MKPSLYLKPFLASALSLAAAAVVQAQLSVEVPLSKEVSTPLDFSSEAWRKAAMIEQLHKMGSSLNVMGMEANEEGSPLTKIYLLRDSEALYIGFECFDPEVAKIAKGSLERKGQWIDGDEIEIYLDGDLGPSQAYYHLAYNPAGARIQQKERETFETEEWSVVSRVDSDAWRSVVRIPYRLLGIDATAEGLRGLFFRNYHPHRRSEGANTRSTWGGGSLHNPSEFGEIRFQP